MGYALTHALYTEAKELLVKEGLSPRKAHLLGLLAKGVDLPSQLAELLEVHPSQVSHLLAALEAHGPAERSPDPQARPLRPEACPPLPGGAGRLPPDPAQAHGGGGCVGFSSFPSSPSPPWPSPP